MHGIACTVSSSQRNCAVISAGPDGSDLSSDFARAGGNQQAGLELSFEQVRLPSKHLHQPHCVPPYTRDPGCAPTTARHHISGDRSVHQVKAWLAKCGFDANDACAIPTTLTTQHPHLRACWE